jgi:hypothetical protein
MLGFHRLAPGHNLVQCSLRPSRNGNRPSSKGAKKKKQIASGSCQAHLKRSRILSDRSPRFDDRPFSLAAHGRRLFFAIPVRAVLHGYKTSCYLGKSNLSTRFQKSGRTARYRAGEHFWQRVGSSTSLEGQVMLPEDTKKKKPDTYEPLGKKVDIIENISEGEAALSFLHPWRFFR